MFYHGMLAIWRSIPRKQPRLLFIDCNFVLLPTTPCWNPKIKVLEPTGEAVVMIGCFEMDLTTRSHQVTQITRFSFRRRVKVEISTRDTNLESSSLQTRGKNY